MDAIPSIRRVLNAFGPGIALLVTVSNNAGGDEPLSPGPDVLAALTEYYGISETEVIDRLAHEAEATRIHEPARQLLGKSYAGAWFDAGSRRLAVALTDSELAEHVQHLGALPVLVERSLEDLNGTLEQIEAQGERDTDLARGMTARYIDYATNQVIIEVPAERKEQIAARLRNIAVDPSSIELRVSTGVPQLASQVRGADCYKNNQMGFECSIGFSVGGGFVTAGHCGAVNDSVSDCNQTALGAFRGSTWFSAPTIQEIDHDSGWVENFSPWQPVPKVNGYNDGILDVPADSGGYREAPVNATVCRYGRTTLGPHCGKILARNQTQVFCANQACTQTVELKGTARTDTCVAGGDSGGPFIAADGQAQGTTIGGLTGTCPNPSETWFQPLAVAFDQFDVTLLTVHGRNPPVITSFNCPDMASSGGGMYFCNMSYDTQGTSPIQWSSNTGHSSTSNWLIGQCDPQQSVSVSLSVTNDWGADNEWTSFPCPDGTFQ